MLEVTTSAEPCPTSVYLYFDRGGILIYVGVTSRGVTRQREHNSDKDWWPCVSKQKVEHYPTRAEALRREQELIELMSPPFNSVHNPDRSTRDAYLALRAAGTATKPANKRLPMRVGYQYGDLLIVMTRMEHASIAATISTDTTGFIVAPAGYKARDVKVRVRHLGSALSVKMRVKDSTPPCTGGVLMYKHTPGGGLQIKRLDLVFATGGAA